MENKDLIFWGIIAFGAFWFVRGIYKTLTNPELLKKIQEENKKIEKQKNQKKK